MHQLELITSIRVIPTSVVYKNPIISDVLNLIDNNHSEYLSLNASSWIKNFRTYFYSKGYLTNRQMDTLVSILDRNFLYNRSLLSEMYYMSEKVDGSMT
jgi:hypothetical protein